MAITLILTYYEVYGKGFSFSYMKQTKLMYLIQKYSFECSKYFDSSHKSA